MNNSKQVNRTFYSNLSKTMKSGESTKNISSFQHFLIKSLIAIVILYFLLAFLAMQCSFAMVSQPFSVSKKMAQIEPDTQMAWLVSMRKSESWLNSTKTGATLIINWTSGTKRSSFGFCDVRHPFLRRKKKQKIWKTMVRLLFTISIVIFHCSTWTPKIVSIHFISFHFVSLHAFDSLTYCWGSPT